MGRGEAVDCAVMSSLVGLRYVGGQERRFELYAILLDIAIAPFALAALFFDFPLPTPLVIAPWLFTFYLLVRKVLTPRDESETNRPLPDTERRQSGWWACPKCFVSWPEPVLTCANCPSGTPRGEVNPLDQLSPGRCTRDR